MSARNTNFGIAQRERERKIARGLEDPYDTTTQGGDPASDAFFGSLYELGQRANQAGMGFRANLGDIGRFTDESGGGGGRLTATDLAGIAGNVALGRYADESGANQMARDAYGSQRLAQIADELKASDRERQLAQAYAMPERASVTTETIGPTGKPEAYSIRPVGKESERDRILSMLPPPMRPVQQAQWAAQDAVAMKAEAEKTKADAAATAAGEGADNVKDAVAGMKEGTLPPILPGRATKDYVKILAEARSQGYDLAGAAQDWTATQKHIASLNSTQQLRLNQAVNQLPELLDSVDTLASQWKAGGKLPILNKANLALAKNGAYGQEAASLANRLSTQIADVNADLGTVYMGGNSPTDKGLELASKTLSEDWDEGVLHDAIANAKKNVQIRQNSIRHTGVAGASANNPYDRTNAAPPAAGAPAAAPGGGAPPPSANPFRKK